MIRSMLLCMILVLGSVAQAQDRWLHVSGLSAHDRPGFQERNWGVGWEQTVRTDWSVAAGAYRNSMDRGSTYALVKYHWITRPNWMINVSMGAVTGYAVRPAAPVFLPELCVSWVCGVIIPRVGPNEVSALALYLRIPL